MSPSQRCTICSGSSDGNHFGATSCRACAAFFRRVVSLNLSIESKCKGKCALHFGSSLKLCRRCRYQKCIGMGMQRDAVQQGRDLIGVRKSASEFEETPCHSKMQTSSEVLSAYGDKLPILKGLHEGFQRLQEYRMTMHNNLLRERQINYTQAHEIHVAEMPLVQNWIYDSFPQYQNLPEDQRVALFRNFWFLFTILECSYFTSLRGKIHIIYLPTGEYFDSDTFYCDGHNVHNAHCEQSAIMCKPIFDYNKKNIIYNMVDLQIDEIEFLFLAALMLWDHGIDKQSEECVQIANNMREKMFKEYIFLCSQLNKGETSLRLANIIGLLPAVLRLRQRIQEETEMSSTLKIYPIDATFLHFINGRP